MFYILKFVIFLINTLTINLFVNFISATNYKDANNLNMNIKSTLSLTATFSNQILDNLCNTCTCEKASIIPDPTTDLQSIGPLTWFESWRVCHNMGAHLAVPSNEKEMNMIVNYLKFINVTEVFIGIHDIFDEGRFVTVHGVPFVPNNFLKWSTSPHLEPDNFNNEDCCVLSRNGFLSDDACTEKRNAICQRYKSFC